MTLSSNGIGVPAYFSSYLARIREAHPDFPLDPVVFQSILLCLIAGGTHGSHGEPSSRGSKHLILRTSPEDIGLVLNLASLVSTSCFIYVAVFSLFGDLHSGITHLRDSASA